MTGINKFSRTLGLFLCLLYIFTGSGLDRLSFQAASLIYRTAVFPCKGKGCQCDKAGYELSNCQCNHDEGVSCCSIPEPEEESCCAEEADENGIQISNIPCQGVEEGSTHSLAKHLVLLPHISRVKNIFQSKHQTPYKASLKEAEILPQDKVPILS